MRKNKAFIWFSGFFILSCLPLLGQDTLEIVEEERLPLVQVSGYLKNLGNLNFDNPLQNFQYDNLIHNRLNSVWNFSPKLQLNADLRTCRPLAARPENGYLNVSISLDYTFKNSLYLQGEFLYNGSWQDQLNPAVLLLEPLPANNLFPAKTVGFLSISYPIHPLLSISYGSIFSPSAQMYIQVPSLTFSLRDNLDLYLVAQILRNLDLEALSPMVNAGFLRAKWSF